MTRAGAAKRLSGMLYWGKAALRSPNGTPVDAEPWAKRESFPAGLNRWIARYTGKNRSAYPPSWRHELGHLRDLPSQRVAVVMHVYFPELVQGILDELENLPVPFDLFVTNASGTELELTPPSGAKTVTVFPVPNRGRDILPLIMLVNAGVLDDHELVLKVHTKKSVWRAEHELGGDGAEWRDELLGAVAGSAENVAQVLDAFASDPSLGIVAADGSVLGPEYWGGDRTIARALLRRIELDDEELELRFAAGSIYWVRAFVLQGLHSLHLSPEDFEVEAGQVDGTTAHAIERVIGMLAIEAGFRVAERSTLPVPTGHGVAHWSTADRTPRARVIPFYLPQFHTFAENDLWWGEGFTEWSNVTSAKPTFQGHFQPFLPSALGFYSLTSLDTRPRQYSEAKAVGIEGFMYYYYWFAGRTLMDRPIEDLVASDDDHPFCVMWANENWSRRWDGSSDDILIGQDYDKVPAQRFIEDIAHLLRDPRYLRIDGRPILAVYRITQIPDFEQVIADWRQFARGAGIGELHLLAVDVGGAMDGLEGSALRHGFDGVLEFPPHNTHWEFQNAEPLHLSPLFEGRIMRYRATVRDAESKLRFPLETGRNPGVMVGFDNTARRQWRPDIWYGANPYTFRRWLDLTLSAVAQRAPSERIVFINAWNEWAEGAVLEPSVRFGRGYLLAVRDALMR